MSNQTATLENAWARVSYQTGFTASVKHATSRFCLSRALWRNFAAPAVILAAVALSGCDKMIIPVPVFESTGSNIINKVEDIKVGLTTREELIERYGREFLSPNLMQYSGSNRAGFKIYAGAGNPLDATSSDSWSVQIAIDEYDVVSAVCTFRGETDQNCQTLLL